MRLMLAAVIIGAVLASQGGQARQSASDSESRVKSCEKATFAKPGLGRPYKGTVRNSDYDFRASIPPNLTAWSGVADEAPFHGFAVFLDATEQSCILFEVHIRVDENAVVEPPVAAKRLALGKAIGWQKTISGVINGTGFVNTTTTFSFVQADQTDDGEIILVAPLSQAGGLAKIYDEFVHNLDFGH
jgi:hypothetical protein